MHGFLSFLVSLGVTMLLIPPLIRHAAALKLVDIPDTRKVHSKAMPRVGGIAMVAGTGLALLTGLDLSQDSVGVILGTVLISLFGAWDDRVNLDYRIKFAGQSIAALVVIVWGNVLIEHIPFFDLALPHYLAIPLTVLALLATTNAINLSDGLDGLAGGLTLLSLSGLALVAYLAGSRDVVIMALAIAGSIFGFLRFNTHPAYLFMGDGGSQFLGFSVGVLSILLTQRAENSLSTAQPLLLLGLPVLDTALVMAQRIRAGRSPFAPDKNHIHHKLLELGFDQQEAVFLLYVMQAVMVSAGFLLHRQNDAVVLLAYACFCVVLLGVFHSAKGSRWRLVNRRSGEPLDSIYSKLRWLRASNRLEQGAVAYVLVSVLAYLYAAVLWTDPITREIGMLGLILLAAQVTLLAVRGAGNFGMLDRISLCLSNVLAVYLLQSSLSAAAFHGLLEEIYFLLLSMAVVIGIRYSLRGSFELTPLDFLVLFMALAVSSISGVYFFESNWGLALAELMVMFYAVELVTSRTPMRPDMFRLVTLGVSGIAAVRGLLL
jgi:UDP-GlcNAc:undecaprenyl-phosphate/decaprenyl-phosphate GlcNAc-1-phosphate transferase